MKNEKFSIADFVERRTLNFERLTSNVIRAIEKFSIFAFINSGYHENMGHKKWRSTYSPFVRKK
ncbi:MAG: hypothetical protein H6Q25_315 [Bacteroidetes bacterium]|nr:hypothetical protein [Bacteroidota bacterium]